MLFSTRTLSPWSITSSGLARKSSQARRVASQVSAISSMPRDLAGCGQSIISNSISGSNSSDWEKSPRDHPS